MPRPEFGAVRSALEVTLKSDRRLSQPKHAALVALCRLLASQIDESGRDANNRLTAAYLSALKDIDRAVSDKTPAGAQPSGALGKLQALGKPA